VTAWREYEAVHGKNNTVSGRVVVWPKLASSELDDTRDIIVYLPPSLAKTWIAGQPPAASAKRYPVLYFNDGQNMFDEKTAYVGEDWKADETLEALAKDGTEAIAVAIPNGLKRRMDEYNPWREQVSWRVLPPWASREMGGKGDAYLDWVVGSVKPLIDRELPTASAPANTAIVGSSMGGLISLYALAARPETFGLAGVFSPSVMWSNFRILDVLRERSDQFADARLYVDAGSKEGRGMVAGARRLRRTLLDIGFAEGDDLMYVEDRAGIHRESAWARRLPDALRFLLPDAAKADAPPAAPAAPPQAG
jgi:predicted alpha/beta superfamily hydrolase